MSVNTKSAKIVVLGDMSVGKTSILTRYIKNSFDAFNESTIGAAFFTKTVKSERNEDVNFEIWDTAGQERYDSLLPMYYRNANVILVVFDLNNINSFNNLRTRWLEIINERKSESLIFLIGNKCDLEENISQDDINNFVEEHPGIEYFKVSAKDDTGLTELFQGIVNRIIEFKAYKTVSNSSSLSTNNSVKYYKKSNCC